MRSRNLVFLAVCLHALAVLLVALALFAVGGGLFYVGLGVREFFDPDYFAEELVDEAVTAGLGEAPSPWSEALLEDRKIVVTSAINERTARVIAERLLYLDRQDGEKSIDLFLSTAGGWVDSAFTIIDAMETVRAPVNVHALAGCYSSGTLVLCAATGQRTATPNSILMVHANMSEHGGRFTFDPVSRRRFEETFRRCADLPATWFPMTGDSLYYLSPDEALRFGVIDEIRSPESAPRE